MPTTRVDFQMTMEADNLKPEDAQVNRWHFLLETDPPNSAVVEEIRDELYVFYASLAAWMPSSIFSGTIYAKAYDMSDPEPRAPIHEHSTSVGTLAGTTALPPEVTCCLSFEALPISGTPQPRRRGRVFLPTFTTARLDTAGKWAATTLTGVAASAGTLLDSSQASPAWKWIVVSSVSGLTAAVDRGWVDDAVDIQRRRGWDPVSRELFA